ncbi:MAG: hypothetical protein HOB82_05705 [Alphaproteobacteria bacterium]|jgi:hypothetical protein|nr:hypothetical protein [Alphaproteobacteria bacterium]
MRDALIFTLWHFRSGDAAKHIATPKYFNASSDMLRPGDFIFVNLENRTLSRNGILAVDSVRDGDVLVAPIGGPFNENP